MPAGAFDDLAVPQILKYKWLEGITGGVQGIVLSKPEVPFDLPLPESGGLSTIFLDHMRELLERHPAAAVVTIVNR